jgi:tetratricopeptide (TPR) repeat protein
LINDKAFFAAEGHLIKGIGLYEDGVNRRLISRSPKFGRLYADLGDLEYFTKDGNMGTALEYYAQAEQNGWAPPEMLYRMGSAYYHQRQWASALLRFVEAASDMPFNRRLLNALGNAAYMRGNYAVAQGYYTRLLDLLQAERSQFSLLLPHERVDHLELAERLMVVWNNFGVTLEALTERTGNPKYHSEALGLYSESARAWDMLTRNPNTLVRMRPGELTAPGINLGYLNAQQALHPISDYERQIYIQIDKDVLEPSPWQTLTPENFHLADGLF